MREDDRVAPGEAMMTEQRGTPVVKPTPSAGTDRNRMLAAAARIKERARLIDGCFDWAEWRDYRDEGRP